ncbi:vegetative cell wall protein gp1-like [Girardinichthys multiradiatus]|uniref:vegetative cell wall protein gp1-like n=1 Tax=Girardinichthys multiradiatus TaxID=208333 RepID=UPI001FABD855|nr:vegetative cell wall protein gp1-like [Girardinichthys multiradiatus]
MGGAVVLSATSLASKYGCPQAWPQPLHATPQSTAPILPRTRQPAEQHTSKPAQPTRPPTAAQRPTPGQDHRRKPWKEGHGGPSYRAPHQPAPPPNPGAPQPISHPHPRMATKQSSPSIKAGPHPNKRRLIPPRRSAAPPQPADQGAKPGAKIQGNASDPERAETPAQHHTIPKTRPPTPAQTRLEGPFPLPASDHR